MLCLIYFVGCTLTGLGSRGPSRIPRADTRDWPVNAYYLFSEAHLSLKKGNVDRGIGIMQQALALDPDSVYLKRELAGFWLMKKDTTAALQLLDDILVTHPDDVESLILEGRIHQNINQPKAAMEAFSQVIELDPSQQNIYLQLGSIYMDQEQWGQAKRVYEQLVKSFPGSYAGYFFLGRISAINGDGETAQAYFEKTLALEPELVESRFEIGALYEADKKYEKAASIYNDILKQNPNNIQASMALGHAYYQQGLKKKAEKIFTFLGQVSLKDQTIIRTLVRDYLDARDYEAANIIIQGMIKGAPDSSDLKYLAGVALDGIGKKSAAIDQLKQVDPNSRFFQNAAVHAALLYQEMEQLQAAIDFLLETVKKDPENPEFHLYLGSFYEQVEAYEKAEKTLKDGLGLDPKNSRIHFRLGVVYDKWGKKESSIAAMKQVIRFEPDNANALNYLGYTYADMGINLDEAEQLIRKALEHKPGDGYITDSLAWVYYKRGQYEKALPLLEQAAGLVPDDPIVKEHLGDVYNKLGMTEKALQSYHQSIENGHSEKAAVEKKIRLLGQ
ncbi:MAG: tetratricopeptide repeat protein [Desulfosarcina sp.]|nr:tetratricopeptide repeat protein [Desulfosarcina sp.]MBC2741676.1 tetratricopeptide repeat protein [Desulfosarcina sp.]MBC2764590.1 tetratricopeptide repeat protein [Desulfosarcina sp.]